ncbi:winged helix-turn-helix domain-containing protein [Glycomyces salinus]|uniref:winged helix-turn-helix domain-containing protein n=1 Tax=Glycomyces salinus TaxID=980294 RepID=UPI0018ECF63B|nr:helix-turn-helix domain-containing protein [Glycomyces salinus]
MPPEPPMEPEPEPPIAREHITDPERMRALAHPARMAVFDFLGARRVQGFDGATATEIAEEAGMSPSAMSYHLRTLAKAGFIEEAPSRGDARERVWRLKVHKFNIEAEEDASESDLAVERTMTATFAAQSEKEFLRYLESGRRDDPALRNLSTVSEGRFRLRPEEVEEFKRRAHELIEEYARRSLAYVENGDAEDGTVIVRHLLRLYPLP